MPAANAICRCERCKRMAGKHVRFSCICRNALGSANTWRTDRGFCLVGTALCLRAFLTDDLLQGTSINLVRGRFRRIFVVYSNHFKSKLSKLVQKYRIISESIRKQHSHSWWRHRVIRAPPNIQFHALACSQACKSILPIRL